MKEQDENKKKWHNLGISLCWENVIIPDVGIYKRKQESKKTRTRQRKRSRKQEKKKENTLSTKKAYKKKRKLPFFLYRFLGRVLVFFYKFPPLLKLRRRGRTPSTSLLLTSSSRENMKPGITFL